ncbi:MAG TPA: AbrB/MazE/SpoVT family DNA-binding domain-containing protein [Longimicrobiales bacterium]|nr:AbrB/MazE/SpoVT family DNA-binding domain-containing protein [Longimicrobiales bacterium]
MKAVVSEKGQVTIPKALRDRMGIRPGQVLEFREENGRLVVTKQVPEDAFASVIGILEIGRSTDEVLEELRGPVDEP